MAVVVSTVVPKHAVGAKQVDGTPTIVVEGLEITPQSLIDDRR